MKLKELRLKRLENKLGYKPYFSWVKDYWTSRGRKLDFKQHKYLEVIYKDQSLELCYLKASQTGLTERAITEALWLPDQFKENSIYFFPTSGTIGDLVQERVDDPLNNNKYLFEVSGRAKRIMGKWADKVGLKRMSKGFVYFRGSNKPTQITSVAGDVVFIDELDRMVQESVPYMDKRLEHSNRKWIRTLSTPTIPGFGIDKVFQQSDRHEYWVRCDHCGKLQLLDFFANVKYDIDKDQIINERVICSKCEKIIVPWALEGVWMDFDGKPWTKEKKDGLRGFHITQLCSPRCDLKKMIKSSLMTSEWEIQQFYNQNLGLAYEPKGSKLTEEDFSGATRDYFIPYKEKNEGSFMGVDVGKVLHIVIRDKDRVLFIGERNDFEDLDRLMAEFNVKTAVIDALPETRKAQEFCNRKKGRVSLCYYSGIKEIKDGEWFKKTEGKVNTDRTLSLDKSINQIKQQNIWLPKNLNSVPDFKTHCKALIRNTKTTKDGNLVAEYVQIGPDHYAHAFNYCNIAFSIYEKTPVFGVMSM